MAPTEKSALRRYTFTLKIEDPHGLLLDMSIGAVSSPYSINKAKERLHAALEEYAPTGEPYQRTAAATTMQTVPPDGKITIPAPPPEVKEVLSDVAAALEAIPPEKRNTPVFPAQDKRPSGVTGSLQLVCPDCGRSFGLFQREPVTEIACRCGHVIQLDRDRLARYRYTCPYCEKDRYGLTNSEAPELEVMCACRATVNLTWDPPKKEYNN